MHTPSVGMLAALLTLAAAAATALAAEYPPRQARQRWRFPASVVANAVANVVLTLTLVRGSEPLPNITMLLSVFLMLYAIHRRARAKSRPDIPYPPTDIGTRTGHDEPPPVASAHPPSTTSHPPDTPR
jgi:hypothetical protein